MISHTTLVGTLGQSPEFFAEGRERCKLRIATHEDYITEAGEKKTLTNWHNVVVWGSRARAASKSFMVGDLLIIVGRYVLREWTDDNGNSKKTTEMVARFIGRSV